MVAGEHVGVIAGAQPDNTVLTAQPPVGEVWKITSAGQEDSDNFAIGLDGTDQQSMGTDTSYFGPRYNLTSVAGQSTSAPSNPLVINNNAFLFIRNFDAGARDMYYTGYKLK